MNDRIALSGLSSVELQALFSDLPAFRARQIFQWIAKGVTDFSSMKNVGKDLCARLSADFDVRSARLTTTLSDEDGTVKLQLTLQDGAAIEAVMLVDADGRKTACISTQVGCPMRCAFCKTGTLGFLRNLTPAEMVDQLLYLRDAGGEISNIVVMGMGEPLLNLANLRAAISIWCDEQGLALSRRRITVSTSGIARGIKDLAENGPDIRLALSLTSAREELRAQLMPVAANDALTDVKQALISYQATFQKRITLEAVLLRGLNTGNQDAKAILDFAKDLDVVVNLIPWNPVEGLGLPEGSLFEEPSRNEVERFARLLEAGGLSVTTRFRRGRGVQGACGQLGSLGETPIEH